MLLEEEEEKAKGFFLTDKAFDAQGLYFHINQQATIGFHQSRCQGQTGFCVSQLNHPRSYAMNQTEEREKAFSNQKQRHDS